MESSALHNDESVCVKTEPFENVYIKEESCESLSIKTEHSDTDVSVKLEPMLDDVCNEVGVSAAAAELYADHVVKVELMLGPEKVVRRGASQISRGKTPEEKPSAQPIIYQCAHCRYATDRKSLLIKHLGNNFGETPFKCNNVHKMMQYLSTQTTYKCDQCSFSCAIKRDMQIHKWSHTGEKPYKCDQCDYASVYKQRLLVHKRIHTSDKPYKCELCSIAFGTKSNLMRHIVIHSKKRPYKCGCCDYASQRKDTLIKHQKRHKHHM